MIMRSDFKKTGMLLVTLCLLNSCNENVQPPVKDASAHLATINGEAITAYQLQVASESLLGKNAAMDARAEKRILDGMIASRAIAQRAEKALHQATLLEIDMKTRLHREKLLLNAYMAENLDMVPISDAQIENYYRRNLADFGGAVSKKFEMITSITKPETAARPQLIERLNAAENQQDWVTYAEQLIRSGFKVAYRQGNAPGSVLDSKLVEMVKAAKKGVFLPVQLVNGKPLVLRVLDEERRQAKPLREVREAIHQALLPLALKDSVQKIQNQIVQESDVRYP